MSVDDLFLIVLKLALSSYSIQVFHHDGKRLRRTRFQISESLHSLLAGCVAAEVKSSDPFDRCDPAAANYASDFRDGRSALHPFRKRPDIYRELRASVCLDQIHLRSAFIAAYRLCIISSGLGMGVFVFALRAHREFRHACADPVIRHAVKDRRPRAARSTIDEWMQISPVLRIEELFFALAACSDVR